MHHFFTDSENISGRDIYIGSEDLNHIKNVLRMKPGEVVSVNDNVTGREYRCRIEGFEEERVHLKVDFIKEPDVELPVKVSLFQCIPKGDKMDLIIQKAVELGVFEIIPVASKRSVVKLDEKSAAKKLERWNRISKGAAEQSKRAVIPEVKEVLSFKEAAEYAKTLDLSCMAYELWEGFGNTDALFEDIGEDMTVGVFIGPEGGIDDEECELAKGFGIRPFSLGKRILRTETAALVFLSWLVYKFEIR